MSIDNRAAIESSIKFLLDRFEGRSCDSQGVATCVRCNAVFLAKSVQKELDRSNTFLAKEAAACLEADCPYFKKEPPSHCGCAKP